jgi:hypothetical protein
VDIVVLATPADFVKLFAKSGDEKAKLHKSFGETWRVGIITPRLALAFPSAKWQMVNDLVASCRAVAS